MCFEVAKAEQEEGDALNCSEPHLPVPPPLVHARGQVPTVHP